jgi:hypothetical protein
MLTNCFLSIDYHQPLAVWWSDSRDCGTIPLDEFLEESKIDMSKKQAVRYADRLQQFVDDLREYSTTSD